MDKLFITVGTTRLMYFQQGKEPKLLFHVGTHGDEHEVIKSVTAELTKNIAYLPPFIFVPEVSPSAVALQTRTNRYGHDLNRSFFDKSDDPEVKANMQLVKSHGFETCYSFHEDPEQTEFYLYDTGLLTNSPKLKELQNSIQALGIPLLSGVDDPNDPTLGFEFKKGYAHIDNPSHTAKHGMFAGWARTRGLLHDEVMFEIPGKATQDKKDALVSAIFKVLFSPS